MARDLFAELGASTAPAANASTGGPRDLFAEIEQKPDAKHPGHTPRRTLRDRRVVTKPTDEQNAAPAANRGPRPGNVQAPLDRGTSAPVAQTGMGLGLGMSSTMQDVHAAPETPQQRFERESNDRSDGRSLTATRAPEATVGNIASGLATSLGEAFTQTERGTYMAFEENTPLAPGDTEARRQARVDQALREIRQSQNNQALARPDIQSTVGNYAYDTADSVLQSTPAIVGGILAGVATGPVGGTAVGLGLAGGQTGAQAYGKYRERGATPGMAAIGAAGEGAIEIGTELLPMGALVEKFGKVGKVGARRLIGEVLGKEMVGEQLATFTQDAIDTAIANPNKTWKQYWDERPDAAFRTGLAVLAQTGLIGGASRAVQAIGSRLDNNGRLIGRNPSDTRAAAPGVRETAVERAATPTEADVASPLPTEAITAGKVEIAKATAGGTADAGLQSAGMPKVGKRVVIDHGDGTIETGTMEDWFEADDGKGVVVKLDNGRTMREYTDTLADAGVTIREEAASQQSEALPDLYHGGRSGLTPQDIEIVRANGQKQGKKGRIFGGFYATGKVDEARGYAEMAGEGNTTYKVELDPNAKVERKDGDITRLSPQTIDEYRARGVDVIIGTDPRGRTEYAIINQGAIRGLADLNAAASPIAEADAIDARLAAMAQNSQLAPTGATSSPGAETEQAAPPARPAGSPVADGGAVIRSIFGDGVRITSQRRQKTDKLTQANPGSWHAKSNAAVDMAPIPGTTFEATKARIEAAGYQLIEAIDEVKNPSKHATGPHWHFVIGEGGARTADAAAAPAAAAEPESEDDTAPAAPRDTNPALIQADATPEGKAMRGPAIDEEWSAFPQQSGTLAIPRAEMPQIKAEHRGAMVNFMNARGVAHEEVEVPASSLKPTQAEYSTAKIEKAKTYEGGNRAILISADGHVLDGHHQWMAALDKGENVRAIRLDAPVRDLVNLAHEFPSSTVEDGASAAAPAVASPPAADTGWRDAFNRNPESYLGAMSDATLDRVGAELGVKRGNRSRNGFIEAISSNPISDVRSAVERSRAGPPAPQAPQQPASTARVEPTPSGKGVAVIGASEAELATIAREVPQAKATKRSDGAWTFSIKHQDAIRAAIASVTQQQEQTPDANAARPLRQSGIQSVEAGQTAMLRPEVSSVQGLRGEGDNDVPGVGARLSGVSRGDGAAPDTAALDRSNRREQGVRAGQRPLGDQGGAEPQSPVDRGPADAERSDNADDRVGRDPGSSGSDAGGSSSSRVAGRADTPSREGDRRQNQVADAAQQDAVDRSMGSPDRDQGADNQDAPKTGMERRGSADRVGETPSKFAGNKLFTEDKVAAAKARMAERMKRLNSGVDPEMLIDGITIAGAYIEAGVRNFAAFAKQMRDDFGPKIQPYLLSFWEGTRYYPGLDTEGMTDPATSKAMHEMMLAEVPVTGEGESATGEVDAQLPNRVPAGDAGSSTGDVQGTSQDRGNGRVPGQEGGGSQGAVRRTDQGAADTAERGAGRSGSGEAGGRAGVRATDRVPAGERDAGRSGNRAAAAAVKGEDWTILPGSLGEERSMMQKARDNVAAIELVKQIDAEGRPATREEQATIARYIGWGGLKNIFPDTSGRFGKGFEELGARLRDLLTPEEYQTAQRSIQYAHYTAEPVVRGMWEIARQLGFKGGLVFEPGMGTGNFRGMMPADIAAASQYQGIEYDHLTASIAKLLYPQSGVRQADYTATPQILDAFDLVIGNPPFSETTIGSDPAYAANKFVLHDFFFAKSLDAVKPGGLLMFISSAGTMNKAGTKAREYLADRADLVGAIRLPGDAFKQNAGTEVTTDIVILRKRMAGEKVGDRSWVDVAPVNLFDRDGNPLQGNVNRYFIANPEMILGEQGMFDKLVAGPRYAVRARPGFDMGRELAKAAERLPFNITGTEPAETTAQTASAIDFNSNERKDGSFYIDADGRLMQFRNGVGQPVQGRGKGTTGGMSAKDQEKVRALVPIKEALREVYAADIVNDEVKGGLARQKLNEVYDAFVKKHGPINKTEISYRRPSRVELESLRAEAREEARLAGGEWDDGSFNVEPFLADGASMSEIARARAEAREAALSAGRVWNEGTFDPDEVPDKVVEKYPNLEAFIKDDEEGYRLAAIEHFNKDTGEAAKGRVFFENAIKLDSKPKINSADDALLYSLNRTGRPDLDLMARMAGRTRAELLEELGDRLFEVPGQPGAYETAEMYLSGDVREKLALAREAAARDSAYARNVRALEAAQPAPLTPSEISANLGMPWIPPRTIEQFATEHMGLKSAKVSYLSKLAAWSAAGDSYSAAATSTWGTERMHAMDLLQAALNRQTPQVFDRTDDGKRVLNAVATQAAQDKMAEMKQAFRDWIWKDEDRSASLVDLYNSSYNSLVAPRFDGSYLTTPGIASGWSWRPHQRQVIARIIQAGNTYMAHEVGAGKTSAMIGAGMEMKRLGLVNKPMYVVPNHMLGQFTKEFYEQYPLARIRVADETRFHTSRRKEFIARMAADDLDAVIITHSAFGFIPMSDAFTEGMIQDQIDELADLLREIGKGQDERITRRRVEQQKEALEQRLKALTNRKRDQVFTFEETGVDFLFVDEAHLFRKLDFATKMGNVKGIDPNGSAMSFDLYAKSRFLEQQKPGRNLVLASGTPITNTMAELYSVSRYLQQGELEKRGLGHFDAWAGAFGDTVTNLEQDPAGGYKPVTRFAQFVNVPELSVMVRQVMDVVGAAELRQYVSLPTLEGGERQMVMAEQTPDQQAYQSQLTARLEAIRRRSGPPAKGDDIILTVINDGRKAAIDYRLIDPTAERDPGSKLERMIDNVARLHKEYARAPFHQPLPEGKGFSEKPVTYGPATQMIFSDFGINGPFPVHKYIRQALVAKGIPANQIAIISDFKTHVAKQRLFNDMNEGKVRVLIGSVAKMGTGVNAQKRLRALHNMDAQWYPANDTQRNGRIIRQGNMNPQVGIYDYATKGTYDSTMWGLMAKKAKFIEGFMRGDPTMRDMEDLGEASQYEQAQAMTTADPRMMDLTEWKQDLEKLQRRKIGHERDQQTNRSKIRWAGNDKAEAERLIPLIEQDIAKRTLPAEGEDFAGTVKGRAYSDPAEFGAALMEAMDDLIGRADAKSGSLREPIGEFAGFALVGETHKTRDGPSADYVILRAGKRETSVRDAGDARGLTTRLTNAVNRFEKELAEQYARIERADREIAEFTPRVGIPFTEDDKIAALRAKITDLESTLDAETKAREAAAKAAADAAAEAKQSVPEDLPSVSVEVVDWGKLPAPGKQRLMILRQRVQRWYDGIVGTTVRSSDGKTVRFNRAGMDKTLRGGEELLLRARAIPKIIQRGKLVSTEPANRRGFKAVHKYAANVRMDGETMPLVVSVREAADGTFHYSLNRYVSPDTPVETGSADRNRASNPALEGGAGDVLNLDVLAESVNPGNADPSAELQARLEGYGIARKVALRVVDSLGGAAGDYSNALIRVATDTTQAGSYTLDHEAVHAMRALGLINQSEWAVLSAKARRDTALMRSIRARYARLDTEGQTEEAVADMFARYQRGDYQAEGTVARVFKALRGALEAIGNYLRGRGAQTAAGVMQRMASGDVGARDGAAPAAGGGRQSFAGQTDTPEFKRWFGNSKVVDDQGQPLVMYHATNAEFTKFKKSAGRYGRRTFSFHAKRTLAQQYGNRVISAYIKAENPFDYQNPKHLAELIDTLRNDPGYEKWWESEARDGDWEMLEKRSVQTFLKANGYDAFYVNDHPGKAIQVFEPNQIKSATDNVGTFDPANPDIRFSMPERDDMVSLGGQDPTWRGKMAEAYERWRTRLQDRYMPLLKVQREIEQQTGKPLPLSRNPYMGEELMTGRIGAQLESLAEDHVEPLFDAMHAEGVTLEELETYLYARHAPERNARIAEINPEFDEGSGSGMTDIEARAIMNRIKREGRMPAMQRLADRVDALRELALETQVRTGLISKADADELRATYKHYVPLRGFKEVEDADPALADRINRSGGGINVRGRESKAAYGRRSQADSPLAYLIMQAEGAIVRGETNLVAQQFVNLAKANPDEDFWQVNKVTAKQRINEETGLVERYLSYNLAAADEKYTVSAKFGGVERRVTMNRANPAAHRLADAMRNLTQHQLDFITLNLGKVNRWLSSVNTSYNPEFVITNAFRDLQTAAFNLSADEVKGLTSGVLKDYRAALVASFKGEMGRPTGEWGKWYTEFASNGGRVSFNQIENIDEIKKRIARIAEMSAAKAGEGGMALQAKRIFFGAAEWIDNANSGVENAVRLAVYKNARERGLSPARAASMAKNVTVNFNRRGTAGPALNAAFLFFNASVQGSARIIQSLRSPRVRKMLAGVMITGALVEMLNAFMSADDDDGEAIYDKIAAFEKERNIILMLPGGQSYLKIPMPYGYNVFWNAGRSVAEIGRRGGARWKETSADFISSVLDAFNPIGGADSLVNLVSPTIFDPIADIALNRDFTGKPIMPEENQYGPQEPDSQRYWGNVSPAWKAVTDFLNQASGGDNVTPGAIDVSPETLEYLSGVAFGSLGSSANRIANLVGKGVSPDEEVTANDLPFARKLYGSKPSWYDKGTFYERLGEVEQQIAYTKGYIEGGEIEQARAYARDHLSVLRLEADAKIARSDMRKIRKAKREVVAAHERGSIDEETYRADMRKIGDAEKLVIRQFNTRWNTVVTGDAGE